MADFSKVAYAGDGELSKVKAISLFSGAGGMDFGAEAAGIKVTYANEIDADACETLRRFFPEQKWTRAT